MDRRGERRDGERVAAFMGDVRSGSAECVVDADQVDVDRPLEHLRVASDQWQLRRHPGVGNNDVEAAKVLGRSLDGGFDLVAIAHVAHHRERIAASCRGPRQIIGLDPSEHDPSATFV